MRPGDTPKIRIDGAALLVGGADIAPEHLEQAHGHTRALIACDAGAQTAVKAGFLSDWVVGDFDSIPGDILSTIPRARQIHDTDQDTTDFQKALNHVEADLFLGVGFLGGRLDHHLASLSMLIKDERAIILIGEDDVICACPRRISLNLDPGTPVSLFPLLRVPVKTRGLQWDIDGRAGGGKDGYQPLAPDGLISTSNRATGPVTIETDAKGALLILPREYLGQLIEKLLG